MKLYHVYVSLVGCGVVEADIYARDEEAAFQKGYEGF